MAYSPPIVKILCNSMLPIKIANQSWKPEEKPKINAVKKMFEVFFSRQLAAIYRICCNMIFVHLITRRPWSRLRLHPNSWVLARVDGAIYNICIMSTTITFVQNKVLSSIIPLTVVVLAFKVYARSVAVLDFRKLI